MTEENFSHERKTSDLNFTDELDNERTSLISNEELVPLCWCLPNAPSVVWLEKENVEKICKYKTKKKAKLLLFNVVIKHLLVLSLVIINKLKISQKSSNDICINGNTAVRKYGLSKFKVPIFNL